MKILESEFSFLTKGIAAAFLIVAANLAHSQTVWNGPPTTFSHTPQNGLQDHMTARVAITRGGSGGLYNAVQESGAGPGSPKDTEWALGSLTNFATLKYGPCPLEQGNRPPNDVGKTYVVHLKTDDIYVSLTLTGWGGAGESGKTTFSYTRTTPSTAPPTPTVSITTPTNGSQFTAPANVTLTASASVSAGTVTNVQFFSNGASLGSVTTAPFSVTASSLGVGGYQLTAVATAAGVSATSAVVNISVTSGAATPTVNITSPANGSQFAAPANVNITADASVVGGTVDSVAFFANTNSLGSIASPPYNLTASNLAVGTYELTAVATAAGISATSAVVTITVTSADTTPTVNITAPIAGAVFSAPANVNITADASVSVGTVDSVAFFANTNSLGSITTPPFIVTASNLVAGDYSLTAVATVAGISATSAVVSISVIVPSPVNVSLPSVNAGQFTFGYSSDSGLSYVIESSSNLVDWVGVATNVATGSSSVSSNAFDPSGDRFYRVGLLPNP